MASHNTPAKASEAPRYRCFLQYTTGVAESGVHPFIQLRARSAEIAARLALAVSGAMAVVEVERLEERAS